MYDNNKTKSLIVLDLQFSINYQKTQKIKTVEQEQNLKKLRNILRKLTFST